MTALYKAECAKPSTEGRRARVLESRFEFASPLAPTQETTAVPSFNRVNLGENITGSLFPLRISFIDTRNIYWAATMYQALSWALCIELR